MVLHQWEMSPFCSKARRCLSYKGLACEAVNFNRLLALPNVKAWYERCNAAALAA